MRRLKENAMLEAEITAAGDVLVEGHDAGRLQGFRFTLSPEASGPDAKALRAAALKALSPEFETRAQRFSDAKDEAIVLASDGAVRWRGEVVGKLAAGDGVLKPRVTMLADEHLSAPAREKIDRRLSLWITARVEKLLGPLLVLENPPDLAGTARGIAFQVSEALGVLDRSRVAQDMKSLEQEGRAKLRALGIRFGAYHIYVPALLKPAPRALATQLYALKHGTPDMTGLETIMQFASSGRASFPADPAAPKALYRAAGFRLCGTRAVRVDILERLADLIRPAIQYRPGTTVGTPPPGTADGDAFVVTGQMTSLAGCAGEDFSSILTSLGYAASKRPGPAITVPLATAPQRSAETAAAAPAAASSEQMQQPPPAPEDEPFLPGIVEDIAPLAPPEAGMIVAGPLEDQPAAEATATAPLGEVPDAVAKVAADPLPDASPAEPPAQPPTEAVAPTVAEAASDHSEVGSAPVAEPELIETWRQQRSHHQNQRPQGARQGRSADGQNQRRRERRPPGEQPAPAATAAAADNSAPARERGQKRYRNPNPAEGGGRQQRREGRPGGRPDRRPEGTPRPVEAAAQRPAAQRPEKRPPKAIDPDNPFAKLMALKARMEEDGRR